MLNKFLKDNYDKLNDMAFNIAGKNNRKKENDLLYCPCYDKSISF